VVPHTAASLPWSHGATTRYALAMRFSVFLLMCTLCCVLDADGFRIFDVRFKRVTNTHNLITCALLSHLQDWNESARGGHGHDSGGHDSGPRGSGVGAAYVPNEIVGHGDEHEA
jgi:hypothetical protein